MQVEAIEQTEIKEIRHLQSHIPRYVSPWAVLVAATIKDLRIAKRYLPNLVGAVVSLVIRLLFFLFFAQIVTFDGEAVLGRTLTGHDLFIFFQGAILLFIFKGTALWTPLDTVANDLYNGTLEYLYSNPASRYAYYVGTILSNVIISQIGFLPFYLVLFFTSGAGVGNMLMVLLVCIAVFIVLIAMGVMVGLLGLLWRQARSMASIIEIALEMLSGAYFPLVALPLFIQYIAYALPFTWGYDLIRYYSFDGEWNTLLPVWQEWLILGVFAVVFTFLSRFLLTKVERHAKQRGLHLI
jgi:ABC-2 type transport system permease protein